MCACQSNCTKAYKGGGRIVLCLLVALPMSVAKECTLPFILGALLLYEEHPKCLPANMV